VLYPFTRILFFNTFDFVKRFKAYFFLLTFCFSTLGYSLELHYCKGQVTDVSFIGSAECVCPGGHDHEDKAERTCTKTCHPEKPVQKNGIDYQGKGCCKTEQLSFYSSSLKALSSHHIPAFELVLAHVFNPFVSYGFYAPLAKTVVEYNDPLTDRDITILTRTFRI
jgi:hypothetical protein